MENSPITCPFCKSVLEPGAEACEVCGRSLSDAVGLPAAEEPLPVTLVQGMQDLLSANPRPSEPPPPPRLEASELHTFGSYPSEGAPATTRQIVLLVAVVTAVSCILVLGGTMLFQFVRTKFNEQSAIASQTADVLARDTRRTEVAAEQTEAWADYSVRSTEEAHATESAFATQALLSMATTWPVILEESFSEDTGSWYVEEGEDELSYFSYTVQDGVYLVDMTAKKGMSQWLWPDTIDTTLDNFYLAADLQMDGPGSMDAGLVFHLSGDDDRDFYLFDVTLGGETGVYLHNNDGWTLLSDYVYASDFSPSGVNRIEIVGRPAPDGSGREFYFFINGAWISTMTDSTLEGGWVGVQVGLSDEGDHGIWKFDNVVLRVP